MNSCLLLFPSYTENLHQLFDAPNSKSALFSLALIYLSQVSTFGSNLGRNHGQCFAKSPNTQFHNKMAGCIPVY
jgi:hypothetical protein